MVGLALSGGQQVGLELPRVHQNRVALKAQLLQQVKLPDRGRARGKEEGERVGGGEDRRRGRGEKREKDETWEN